MIPWTAALQVSLPITNFWNFLKLMSLESVMPSKHFILCCPLLLLPSIFPSIRVFSSELAPHISGQSTGASTSASVLPKNIHDWFPLGLTSLISLQSMELSRVFFNTNSSKASILWHSAFLMVQLSHPYMTAGKTIALKSSLVPPNKPNSTFRKHVFFQLT